MDPKAVAKARTRHAIAAQQLDAAANAKSHNEFAGHWYLFLIAAKNVYTLLEQGAKATAQSRQWFGGIKNERKSDPLLQYLFQARDDDEHGIGDVTRLSQGFLRIGKAAEGFSSSFSLNMSTDASGRAIIHKLESLDGLPVLIENRGPHSVLLPVVGRGNVTYSPPTHHLGKPLPDDLPMTVGRAGLDYLAGVLSDAVPRSS